MKNSFCSSHSIVFSVCGDSILAFIIETYLGMKRAVIIVPKKHPLSIVLSFESLGITIFLRLIQFSKQYFDKTWTDDGNEILTRDKHR